MPKEPSLADVIGDAMESRVEDIFTATIGRVESYDAKKRTIDVLPVIKRPFNIGAGEVDHEGT